MFFYDVNTLYQHCNPHLTIDIICFMCHILMSLVLNVYYLDFLLITLYYYNVLRKD